MELASSASSFAVCGYCNSGLSLHGDVLEQTGKISQVLEDYSPLQLGSSGVWRSRAFTVVGRIQLRYSAGFWNEWYVHFDNNTNGWLSDASGEYAFFEQTHPQEQLPPFATLQPGKSVPLTGQNFVVSDVRTAQCVGAQGELPFSVSERWTAKVADLRLGSQMLTLDYSDENPVLYQGATVSLDQLKTQMLRDEQAINEAAGRIKGKLQNLACPSCGSAISAVAGVTPSANCGACGSVLDTTGKTATLIAKGIKAEGRVAGTFLQVGNRGVLKGVSWTVIGVMCQKAQQDGETYRWTDYLLFNAQAGFVWLSHSQSSNDWSWCEVLQAWPTALGNDQFGFKQARFEPSDDYVSEVERAWGSFNWEVRAGNKASCSEYVVSRGSQAVPVGSLLVSETTHEEQSWTLCTPLDFAHVAAAFGKAPQRVKKPAAKPQPERASEDPVDGWIWGAAIVHGGIFLFNPTFFGLVLGLIAAGGILAINLNVEE